MHLLFLFLHESTIWNWRLNSCGRKAFLFERIRLFMPRKWKASMKVLSRRCYGRGEHSLLTFDGVYTVLIDKGRFSLDLTDRVIKAIRFLAVDVLKVLWFQGIHLVDDDCRLPGLSKRGLFVSIHFYNLFVGSNSLLHNFQTA
jgi:hypothetical protein